MTTDEERVLHVVVGGVTSQSLPVCSAGHSFTGGDVSCQHPVTSLIHRLTMPRVVTISIIAISRPSVRPSHRPTDRQAAVVVEVDWATVSLDNRQLSTTASTEGD